MYCPTLTILIIIPYHPDNGDYNWDSGGLLYEQDLSESLSTFISHIYHIEFNVLSENLLFLLVLLSRAHKSLAEYRKPDCNGREGG